MQNENENNDVNMEEEIETNLEILSYQYLKKI